MAVGMPNKPGRPRTFDERSDAKVEIRVTPAQRLELERLARENHTGLSAMLRDAALCYCADARERLERQRQ